MKVLRINRRGRKKLMRARSWIVRWDSPAVERPRDAMKHLSRGVCEHEHPVVGKRLRRCLEGDPMGCLGRQDLYCGREGCSCKAS